MKPLGAFAAAFLAYGGFAVVAAAAAPAGVVPPGADVRPTAYVEEVATGEKGETLILAGVEELRSQVWGERLLAAPVTGKPCVYYWLEVVHETPEVNYHLLTDVSDNRLYVKVGDVYVEVGQAKRGWPPDVVKTFKAGQEPGDFPCPAHCYAEVTYRVWLLTPGKTYKVRVERLGAALPPEGPGGEPTYETYYHFTFR